MKYSHKPIDHTKNIAYGSVYKEEYTMFDFDESKEYPIRVEMVGITNPDKNYYISRKVPHYFVIEYVEDGEGYIEVNGKNYKVYKDCVYILSPGISHKYGADKNNPYRKIWINCFSSFLNEFLIAYGLKDVIVFENSGCKKYFDELLRLAVEKPFNKDGSVEVSKILFNLFFALCEKKGKELKVPKVVQRCKGILDSSIYRKVTIEQLCEEVSVSKSQITRDFKKYYNCTPYNYLLNKKINIAKQLLLLTDKKVGEISDTLCFSDEYNFSNLFCSKVGVRPLEYRKREGNI